MPAVDPLVGPVTAPDLHVMTLNVRRPSAHLRARHPDRWDRRRPVLGTLLATERPTMLGLQELVPEQAAFVADTLGPGWTSVVAGRDADGGGEACALFVETARLEVLDHRQWALSATPDVPGSRTFGNLLPRVAVGVTLRDRAVGTRFLVVVTHLDHLSARSRLASAEMLRSLVAASGLPAIVMGDWNADAGSPPYRALVGGDPAAGAVPPDRGAALVDTWTAAATRITEPWGTFSHYRAPQRGGRRIDWLLATSDWRVVSAGVNTLRSAGQAASDHEAVQAVLRAG